MLGFGGYMRTLAALILLGLVQSTCYIFFAQCYARESNKPKPEHLLSLFHSSCGQLLSNHNEDTLPDLDDCYQQLIEDRFPDFHPYFSDPNLKLAHLTSDLILWEQMMPQIRDLIWKNIRNMIPREDLVDVSTRVKDLIKKKVKNSLGSTVIDDLKDQLSIPAALRISKDHILTKAWNLIGKQAENIRLGMRDIKCPAYSREEYLKDKYNDEEELSKYLDLSIHYAFIMYQWASIVLIHSDEYRAVLTEIAAEYNRIIHSETQKFPGILSKMKFQRSGERLVDLQLATVR